MGNWITRAKAWAASAWARFKAWMSATAIAILAALGFAVTAQDNSVTLSWDNATQYTNGDPLPIEEIAETRIYRATYPVGTDSDGSATYVVVDSVPPTVTTYRDVPGGSGNFCYHLTHLATNGGESGPSAEVCKEIDVRVPGNPQNVTAE